MDNVKIIKIETNGAITSVQDLRNHIKELQDILVNTEKDTDEYNQAVNELVASQTKLNEVMAATKKNASAAEGSYNALVNQMNALKTAWRATTSEVTRTQLGEKIKAINEQLKDYDASIGNNQRKVGSYEEALQTLNATFDNQRKELAALKNVLDNLEPGTNAYNEAFERATEITHNLQERQEELRMSANDLGTQLSNVASIGAGLVSGFNAVNAIMALTGQKNEDLQKTMVKLQAGIALVQSAKGLEGAAKSMKAYANWAARAYDSIVKFISGSKAQQKQIQATTVASEANAAANNQVAASETAAATGAKAMGAGMQTAAVGTTTATVAMTAFKAVLMSLGIGIVIAAISGLISLIGKLASTAKKAREQDMAYAELALENEQKRVEDEIKDIERRAEASRAAGKSELEVLKQLDDGYSELFLKISNSTREAEAFRNALQLKSGKIKDGALLEATYSQLEIVNNKLKSTEKTSVKSARSMATQMLAAVKYYTENGSRYMREMLINDQDTYDKLLKKGVKTYEDLAQVSSWYVGVLKENQAEYEIDPLAQNREDRKNEAASILAEAEDAMLSEIQLENKHYKEQRGNYQWSAKELETLRNAHNKRVYEMVTAATQSIIDSARQANQTELENLTEKYQKELKILKQYGRDTTELTKAYEKQKTQIIYNGEVKATENAIKELERYASDSGPVSQAYERLEAMGVAHAKDLEAAQYEQYEKLRTSLEQQFEYWRDLWNKYQNDENLTQDQRLALQEKFLNAKNALEKSETDYLLKQIKTRKQALDEEIDNIEKNYNNVSRMQSLNTEYKYAKNSGFGDTFWGARQNASYGQMKEDMNASYNIDKARLQEEIAAYQDYAANVAKTDAEITYAKKQEAAKRMELSNLERQNLIDNLNLEIDQQKELINTIVDVGSSIGDILGSVADAWESSIQAQVNAGELSQEEADKQMENVRSLQILQTTINMLAGSFGAFAQASQTIPPPYGQIVGAAAAAAVIAQGIAQIAAIKAANKNGGTGGSTMMAQVTPVMTDYQPQMVGTATGEQETEQLANALQKQPLRAYVVESDISEAQAKSIQRQNESTF